MTGNKEKLHLGFLGGGLILLVFLFPPFSVFHAKEISMQGILAGTAILALSLFSYVDLPWLNASFGFYNPLVFCYILIWGKGASWPVLCGFTVFFILKKNGLLSILANVGRYVFATALTAWFYQVIGGSVDFSTLTAGLVLPIAGGAIFHILLDFAFLVFHFSYLKEFPGFRRTGAGYVFEPPFYFLAPFVPIAYHSLPIEAFSLIPLFFLAALWVSKFGMKSYVERDRLQILYDLAEHLSTTLHAKGLLPEICGELAEKLKAKGCAIYLFEEERLRKIASAGLFAEPGAPETLDRANLPSMAGEAKIFNKPSRLLPEKFFPLAALALKSGEKRHGYLFLVRPFTSGEQEKFLSILAGQISSSLENSLLFEEAVTANENLRAVQAQLIQASKLAAVGQLAAGIAHEINNPLGAILLSASQLAKNPADREACDIVLEASRRCRGIVQRLLDFSRQAKGEEKPFKVRDAVEAARKLWEPQLRNQDILLRIDQASSPEMMGETDALVQVISNLISNARDAIHDKNNGKGTIRIHIGESGNQAVIEISDDGVGIPENIIPKIFDPFFTTKEVGKGTGLGLSVSYGIVKKMRGEIEVQSKAGEGTEFRIAFPKSEPRVAPKKSSVDEALKLL